MLFSIQDGKFVGVAPYLPPVPNRGAKARREAYEHNRHRVYALAFWMTDNELAAEELMIKAFRRALATTDTPGEDEVDRALIDELRKMMPLGTLSLDCSPSRDTRSVRYNIRRVDLERAVVQLPPTEKLIFLMHDVERYSHERIARRLGLTEGESRQGLHQARLCLRQLLAESAGFRSNRQTPFLS